MHAVVVRVKIGDREHAERGLREEIVPRASQAPGFVSGYWTYKDGTGMSLVVFESEEAANKMAEQIRSAPPEPVTLEDVEVREVVAHA